MTQTEVIYSLRAGFRPAEVTQTFLLPNESNCETCTVCTRAPPEGERPAPRPWWAVSSGVEAELELRATDNAPRLRKRYYSKVHSDVVARSNGIEG